MAYGRRRIPYEQTDAGIREANRKKKNDDYHDVVNSKIKGLVKVVSDNLASKSDVDYIKKIGPRDKWKRVGYESGSDGSPTENFFEIPNVGYFVDYGMGGTYYVKPRVYKRIAAITRKGKNKREFKGSMFRFKHTSRTPMLKKITEQK